MRYFPKQAFIDGPSVKDTFQWRNKLFCFYVHIYTYTCKWERVYWNTRVYVYVSRGVTYMHVVASVSLSMRMSRGSMYVVYSISFRTFFVQAYKNCRCLLKIHYLIAIHLMRWLTHVYDFRFKWTATAAIGIHPTKTWFSQLVNFKNAIWNLEERNCNKIVF